MGREHLLTDNPEAIAFGRARLSALRAAGKRYVTQVYDTPFGRVTVRIVGGVEYISAESGGWDYLVWPTDRAHPRGVEFIDTKAVSPLALMTLGDKLKRKENVEAAAGPHDWISKDRKRVLSYDHGHGFRYSLVGGSEHRAAKSKIWVKGEELDADHGVKGAAYHYGESGAQIVYASYVIGDMGSDKIRFYRMGEKPGDGDELIGEIVTDEMITVAQPLFFDGLGSKFVTVLETITVNPEDPLETTVGEPRFVVRGTVFESDGELATSHVIQPLAMPADVDDTIETAYSANGGPLYPSGGGGGLENLKLEEQHDDQEVIPVGPDHWIERHDWGYRYQGSSTSIRRKIQHAFIGLDMTPDGQEMLLVSRTRAEATDSAEGVTTHSGKSTRTTVVSVSDTIESHQARHLSHKRTGTTVDAYEWLVNGVVIGGVDRSYATSTNTWLVDAVQDYSGNMPPPRFNAPMETGGSNARHYQQMGVRDVDARRYAIAYLKGEMAVPRIATPPAAPTPYRVFLRAAYDGDEFEKEIFSSGVYGLPPGIGAHVFYRRSLAARRDKEYVIAFSPATIKNEEGGYPDPFFSFLEFFGPADRSPLLALRKKGKAVSPSPFTLSDGQDFRLDPVYVL